MSIKHEHNENRFTSKPYIQKKAELANSMSNFFLRKHCQQQNTSSRLFVLNSFQSVKYNFLNFVAEISFFKLKSFYFALLWSDPLSMDSSAKHPPEVLCRIAKDNVRFWRHMSRVRRTDSGLSHSVIRGLVTDRLMTTP